MIQANKGEASKYHVVCRGEKRSLFNKIFRFEYIVNRERNGEWPFGLREWHLLRQRIRDRTPCLWKVWKSAVAVVGAQWRNRKLERQGETKSGAEHVGPAPAVTLSLRQPRTKE